MGKVKKQPKFKQEINPYVKAPQKGTDAEMGEGEDATAAADMGEPIADLSKGKLKNRQHTEWKRLRHSLEELAKEKRKLKNKDFDEKREKKILGKHMNEMRESMQARHKAELEEWDRY